MPTVTRRPEDRVGDEAQQRLHPGRRPAPAARSRRSGAAGCAARTRCSIAVSAPRPGPVRVAGCRGRRRRCPTGAARRVSRSWRPPGSGLGPGLGRAGGPDRRRGDERAAGRPESNRAARADPSRPSAPSTAARSSATSAGPAAESGRCGRARSAGVGAQRPQGHESVRDAAQQRDLPEHGSAPGVGGHRRAGGDHDRGLHRGGRSDDLLEAVLLEVDLGVVQRRLRVEDDHDRIDAGVVRDRDDRVAVRRLAA